MWTTTTHLKSVSPYSQSRYHNTPKKEKESHNDYENRTWRNKAHVTEDGFIFIPPMAFKNCLDECAKYLSIQIKGKGRNTYTKHFTAGVLVTDPLVLLIKKDEVKENRLFLPSDGRKGGTTRVPKSFPIIHNWEGDVVWNIFDETITKDVFQYHLKQAGMFIGVGMFRPRNGGYFGRFDVEKFDWQEISNEI